ncbi:MAG: hypothetical protein KatS3mg054_0442 [Chloroflexus sp.]|nr:MAG: hypothetical protein KatS3mg054_0207 [Chloroflexus sp.]GIV86413.1 MAG: hypothetical protein KatS3mg054_0442 [Chloroflexus sp.]
MELFHVERKLDGFSVNRGFLFQCATWLAEPKLAMCAVREYDDDVYLSDAFGVSLSTTEVSMGDVHVIVYYGNPVCHGNYWVLEPTQGDEMTVAFVIYYPYEVREGVEQNGIFILRNGERARVWFYIVEQEYTFINRWGNLCMEVCK